MSCLDFICGGSSGLCAKPLAFAQEEQAGVDAACKLMANFEKVVQDITNAGPLGLGGGQLTQEGLMRVDPKQISYVKAMVRAACSRLLGKEALGASTPEEALAWNQAARFLGGRIQGSREECPGREPDMSSAAAAAMSTVLGQIEAGSKLMSNRERVVKDITNPGPQAVGGGQLTQLSLKRMDRKHQASVDAMMREVCGRLLGNKLSEPSTPEEARVWAEAAGFFNLRIQKSADGCPGREADTSPAAAAAMRTVLAQIPNMTKTSRAAATALCTALGQM